jgi:hypothetical protein
LNSGCHTAVAEKRLRMSKSDGPSSTDGSSGSEGDVNTPNPVKSFTKAVPRVFDR